MRLTLPEKSAIINMLSVLYAGVAELADAPDLGSGGRPCRFKSCYPQEYVRVFYLGIR